jgi:hypothetical protein
MFPTELISPSGISALFMTEGTPLEAPAEANGNLDLYQSLRTPTGWQVVRRLSPSGSQAVFPNAGGVSEDHRYTFTEVGAVEGREGGTLAEKGDASYLGNPDGSYELLGVGSLGAERLAQGRYISAGGEHIIFSTGDSEWCLSAFPPCPIAKLEPLAPPSGTAAIYDRSPDGPTKVVSLLPDNEPLAGGEDAIYQGSSRNGAVIAFKVGETLYVRVNNRETIEVTEAPSTFAGISADGDRLFYLNGGDIYEFILPSRETKRVTVSGDAEIVNISADGSHVYFLSRSLLDGGDGIAGEPNLYVWAGAQGAARYVTTVSPADVDAVASSPTPSLNKWTSWSVTPQENTGQGPGANASRTTPDGRYLVFESRAELTGYPTAGHTEIYRYDDAIEEILCVSCNPLRSPAQSDARLEALKYLRPSLGGAETVINNLSIDGARVFFETAEPLVEDDVDSVNDIYQWRQLPGDLEPSLDLISPGDSTSYPGPDGLPFPRPNLLFAVSPNGHDVLFLSLEPLVPGVGEGGVSALYDARIDGGFAIPSSSKPCAQPCRAPAAPAVIGQSPASETVAGNGNIKAKRHRCKKGKHRKKHSKRRACHRKQAGGRAR